MTPFPYKIITQWNDTKTSYEAFVPSLVSYTQNFVPEVSLVFYSNHPDEAMKKALQAAKDVVRQLEGLAILPPPADVFLEKKELLAPPEVMEVLKQRNSL